MNAQHTDGSYDVALRRAAGAGVRMGRATQKEGAGAVPVFDEQPRSRPPAPPLNGERAEGPTHAKLLTRSAEYVFGWEITVATD
jgi:hypothetical protein